MNKKDFQFSTRNTENKLNLPKFWKIGKHKVDIKLKKIEDAKFIGRLNTRTFEILLNDNYPNTIIILAIIHEFLHFTGLKFGFYLDEDKILILSNEIYEHLIPFINFIEKEKVRTD